MNSTKNPEYTKSQITFGKYKGRLVVDIIRTDPQWILWAVEKISFFNLPKSFRNLADKVQKNKALSAAEWRVLNGTATAIKNRKRPKILPDQKLRDIEEEQKRAIEF